MIEKYGKKYFLTEEMLRNLFAEFAWPVAYTVQQVHMGVNVEFDKCRLFFSEGWEGNISLSIFPDKNEQEAYSLTAALMIISPEDKPTGWLLPLGLSDYPSDVPSEERTLHNTRNVCAEVHHYLLPSLQGDFSWVIEYEKIRERLRKRFE
jgi:hypothetical protein